MNCDVVIFNSKQKITSFEEIDEASFVPVDFCAIMEKHFEDIICDGQYREIQGPDYSIHYLTAEEPESNIFFNLDGETALFELIRVAKMYNWQIFDTGTGQMLNLKHPERNGYKNFQNYEQQVPVKRNEPRHHSQQH